MRSIRRDTQFKRDVKRLKKRKKDFEKLKTIIRLLVLGEKLPPESRDHRLKGTLKDCRECHVEPVWLLIYRIEGSEHCLVRTGSHTDLFEQIMNPITASNRENDPDPAEEIATMQLWEGTERSNGQSGLKTGNDKWMVYLLQCADGSLYCGVTNNLEKRLAAHNAGTGAKYTRSRMPVELICTSPEMSKSEAFKLEYRVKRAPAKIKQLMVGSKK